MMTDDEIIEIVHELLLDAFGDHDEMQELIELHYGAMRQFALIIGQLANHDPHDVRSVFATTANTLTDDQVNWLFHEPDGADLPFRMLTQHAVRMQRQIEIEEG